MYGTYKTFGPLRNTQSCETNSSQIMKTHSPAGNKLPKTSCNIVRRLSSSYFAAHSDLFSKALVRLSKLLDVQGPKQALISLIQQKASPEKSYEEIEDFPFKSNNKMDFAKLRKMVKLKKAKIKVSLKNAILIHQLNTFSSKAKSITDILALGADGKKRKLKIEAMSATPRIIFWA